MTPVVPTGSDRQNQLAEANGQGLLRDEKLLYAIRRTFSFDGVEASDCDGWIKEMPATSPR